MFTGLRPGEKLEEDLWEKDARVEPTAHPEVLRVSEADPVDGAELVGALGALASAAGSGDRMQIEAALAQLPHHHVRLFLVDGFQEQARRGSEPVDAGKRVLEEVAHVGGERIPRQKQPAAPEV